LHVDVGWGVPRDADGFVGGQRRAVEGLSAARAAREAIGDAHDSLVVGLGRSSTAGMGVRRRGMYANRLDGDRELAGPKSSSRTAVVNGTYGLFVT